MVGIIAHFAYRSAIKDLHLQIATLKQSPTLPKLNAQLLTALVIGEDHRFFYHGGIDPVAIVRACVFSFCGVRQGGSTIEQQLVRTLTNDYRRKISRKIKEALLSVTLNSKLSKTEIATLYLSVAYFGYRMQGIDAVAKKFNVFTWSDVDQCCWLITHLKYPFKRIFCPKHQSRCERRAIHVKCNVVRRSHWLPIKSLDMNTTEDDRIKSFLSS